MLKYKKLSPPYILIGHSLGGHIVRYYAYLYPNEVAGLVLLDEPHEDWFKYVRETWDPDDQKRYFKFWNIETTNIRGFGLKELDEYEANCDSIRGKQISKDIPVLMFTGKAKGHFRKDPVNLEKDYLVWKKMQHSLIENVGMQNKSLMKEQDI